MSVNVDRAALSKAIADLAGNVSISDVDRYLNLTMLIAPFQRIDSAYHTQLAALYVLYLWDTTENGTSTQQIASEREGDLSRTYVVNQKNSDPMRNSLWGRMIQDLLAAHGVAAGIHNPGILVSPYQRCDWHGGF